MNFIILFFLEIGVLYFLSRRVIRAIFQLFYRLTRSRNASLYLFSILFLPGTFIHEIAHFLTALLLLVPVGKVDLLPRVKGGEVILGSVSIDKTDFLRRFLVGVAPFVAGVVIILGALFYFSGKKVAENPLYLLIIVYTIFTISNSMFASKKDLEGAAGLIIFLSVLYLLKLMLGVSFPFMQGFSSTKFIESIVKADLFLLVPLVIDTLLILVLDVSEVSPSS